MRLFRSFCFSSLLFLLFTPVSFSQTLPPWGSEVTAYIQNGGVYVQDAKGKVLLNFRGEEQFIPASTFKVITGLAALEVLGKDYRFKTDFYFDGSKKLYVKGYGDPYLVSEELAQIAKVLKSKGLKSIEQIILDDSYFEVIKVPGASASLNPYDALNSSLSANFNTIFIEKRKGGEVFSAEPQTPMTELTRTLASRAPFGKSRINLAAHPDQSLLYVGHLLKAFLEQEGVSVQGSIVKGTVSPNAKLLYRHFSSKSLEEVVQAMMKFSTNFISNQLFLALGAEKLGAPATLGKGKKVVSGFLREELRLTEVEVEEGSGLSRNNRISPANLVKILKAFEKYRHLLPEKLGQIQAKTGTLHQVSALAGYFDSAQHQTVYFAIILNQDGGYREKIAKVLYQYLH